tara:strand:- start:41 stop:952 length:912 start_codon:yes stop_codon:yes gene_type:complete
MINNKNSLSFKNYLPISCLGSIYINTDFDELYLSLKSIFFQKYVPNQIIIVVDGPIDNKNKSFINYLQNKYSIIEIIYLEINKGLGFALNKGIEFCKNDIIARFDTDDINLENRFEIQYKYLCTNNDIDILGTAVKEFKENNNIIMSRLKKVSNSHFQIIKKMNYRNPINHPTVMFKKNIILKCGSYQSMKYFEDYHLWLRCKYKNYKFHNLNISSVAMKMNNLVNRRQGCSYAFYEALFFISCLSKRLIKFESIILFSFRLFSRFIPRIIFKIIFRIDPTRNKYNEDKNLEDYIKKLRKLSL